MSAGAQAALLPDGKRLHLHHGPIDLICGVDGADRERCFSQAARRFATVLDELVPELPVLRAPVQSAAAGHGAIAQRMHAAVAPHAGAFVTLMAAVAGAVADEVLGAMIAGQAPRRAYVNNGGDISFHLSGNEQFSVLGPAGPITFRASDPPRGVATSGWRGRSYSLGIADAVTVVAKTAAAADVAATLIANAVDLPGHPAITRRPASELSPDSDLGARRVTTEVGALTRQEARRALEAGRRKAARMQGKGLILQAVLALQGELAVVEEREALDA